MDVVVPVIASCGPRAGQRAARGGRRRRLTDWGRKDRRTSPSWVSGARVAGALRPLLRRAHSPRRPLPRTPLRVPSPRLPGSAAAASPRSGSATFAAGPGAAARRGSPAGRPLPRQRLLEAAELGGAHLPALCGFGEPWGGGAVPRPGAQRGPWWHEQERPRPLRPALDLGAFTPVLESLAAAGCSFGLGHSGMEEESTGAAQGEVLRAPPCALVVHSRQHPPGSGQHEGVGG